MCTIVIPFRIKPIFVTCKERFFNNLKSKEFVNGEIPELVRCILKEIMDSLIKKQHIYESISLF